MPPIASRPSTSDQTRRRLTSAEIALAARMFGDAIDYDRVTINRRAWWPLQPRQVTMAPDGHLWFHPRAPHYRPCFADAPTGLQAHFIHEMTHVWQAARGGTWWLPLMRHPFCRYDYAIVPGRRFEAYGIEQQAEIVRHAFLLRQGLPVPGSAPLAVYREMLPFWPA